MKRYAVFSFWEFYPTGGWNDFVGSFDTLDEAMSQDGVQVVDLQTGELLKGKGAYGFTWKFEDTSEVRVIEGDGDEYPIIAEAKA